MGVLMGSRKFPSLEFWIALTLNVYWIKANKKMNITHQTPVFLYPAWDDCFLSNFEVKIGEKREKM